MDSVRLETLGRYRLLEEIGRGGHGHVYRAVDPALERPVALKELKASLLEDPKARDRFLFEARAVAQLKHPNIAAVYEFGQDQGFDFIAFEYIEGRTLKTQLESDGPLPPEVALEILRQLCDALDYAHGRGVVHCDLKPGNIMINEAGEPTIVDFGLSWLARAGSVTATQTLIGTPRYMSPEQIQGRDLDGRSDLYSLASVFYEMLAGRPPFNDETYATLLSKQLQSPPPPLSERNPRFAGPIDDVLGKAMAKAPANRYQTCGEFYLAARQALPLARPVRSWRKIALVCLTSVVSLALLTGLGWVFRGRILSTVQAFKSSTPAEGSVWLSDAVDEAQARNVQTLAILRPTPRWKYELPIVQKDGLVGVVAAQHKVVVGLRNGTLEALNWDNGERVWKISLDARLYGPPCLVQNKEKQLVVSATESDELVAVSLSDGSEVWRIRAEDLPGGLFGGVTVGDDGQIYGASSGGRLVAVIAASGEFRWTLDLAAQGECDLAPVLSDAAAFVAFESGVLIAVERSRREVAWKARLNGVPVAMAVNRNLGVVIGATESGEVAAFSLLTGKKMWSAAAPGGILGMQVGPSQVVVVCQDKHVYAWSCRSGAAQWLARLDSVPTGPPLSDGNTLLLTTQDGLRYLQLQTGQELKERRMALPAARHPAALGAWLLLGTGDFLEALAP